MRRRAGSLGVLFAAAALVAGVGCAGSVGDGDARASGDASDAALAAGEGALCGDQRCPTGHYCLRNCYGIPLSAVPCASGEPEGPCALGTMRSECRGAGGETRGCVPVGRCVPLRAGCSLEAPSCGCFTENPCSTGACTDSARDGFACPACG